MDVLFKPIGLIDEGVRMYTLLLKEDTLENPRCAAAMLILKDGMLRIRANCAADAYDIDPVEEDLIEAFTVVPDHHFGNTVFRRLDQMIECKSKRAVPVNPDTAVQFYVLLEYEDEPGIVS